MLLFWEGIDVIVTVQLFLLLLLLAPIFILLSGLRQTVHDTRRSADAWRYVPLVTKFEGTSMNEKLSLGCGVRKHATAFQAHNFAQYQRGALTLDQGIILSSGFSSATGRTLRVGQNIHSLKSHSETLEEHPVKLERHREYWHGPAQG